jgi:hypothetical protein
LPLPPLSKSSPEPPAIPIAQPQQNRRPPPKGKGVKERGSRKREPRSFSHAGIWRTILPMPEPSSMWFMAAGASSSGKDLFMTG